MEGFIRQVLEQAAAFGLPWWAGIALILILAVAVVGIRMGWQGLKNLPPPPSGPVDNAPGSDGSSPDDEAGKKAVEDGVASGKYRWQPTDPNTPPDPSGGGG